MDPEKRSNVVGDDEIPKDISSSLDEGNEVVSGGVEKTLESHVAETPELEVWNKPRINQYRYFATLITFIVMGMNDAAYGVSYFS